MTPPALRLIVGFSRGSASDEIAHMLAPPLAAVLGAGVEIERRQGADGAVAACELMVRTPDGTSLMVATLGTHALNPSLVADLPYHPLDDFSPVALVAEAPMILATAPASGIGSVAELIARARAAPGAIAFGCSAKGGAPWLAGALFRRAAGIDIRPAIYRETKALYADLAAGRIAISFNNVMSMLPALAEGTLAGLAVTGRDRLVAAPTLPTLAECGLAGCELSNWVGLVAPRGTPAGIVASLNAAVRAALADPTLARALAAEGISPGDLDAPGFGRHIRAEIERWVPVLKDAA